MSVGDAGASCRTVAVGLGVGAAVLCAGRCMLSTTCWCIGPGRAKTVAEAAGVELSVRSVSMMGPATSPLSITLGLSGLHVNLEGVIGRLLPCSALGGGVLRLEKLELCFSPLSGSARLVVRDVQIDVRPLTLEHAATRETRLRQAQRAAWRHRHLLLDVAMYRNFWRRQAAAQSAWRLDLSGRDDSSDAEDTEVDGWNDGAEHGTGVPLLRPQRDLDMAPAVHCGWVSYMIKAAATRYALGILDRTEILVQDVRVSVHAASGLPSETAASRLEPEQEVLTVRLNKLSLGQAPHAADQSADERVVRDPPTAVPTHDATLGRRSAWVRRRPLSPELTLSALPMRSVWMRKTKAAVSPTVSLSLLKERLERWFPPAASDCRVGDQRQSPVAVSAEGPVSLLPSIHTLSAIGLTVQCLNGSDEQSCTVLEQKMLRVDIAACVDDRCWMRALDAIVLDAVNIAITPLEASAALAPIVRAFAHGYTALRYAHQHITPSTSRQSRHTPDHSVDRRKRSVKMWQFAYRCVRQELRRVRPSAAVRWTKLEMMLAYQKQWQHFVAQAHRIGPSGRQMLQLIMKLARETIASMAMPVSDCDQRREVNRSGRQVLVSRNHAEEWANWVRNRRSHGVMVAGRTSVAAQITKIVSTDLAAMPESAIRLWARRRHLILATVELVMLECQPAADGHGAADGGGYAMSTDEMITVRERTMLDHPINPDCPNWAASMPASISTSEPDSYDTNNLTADAYIGLATDLLAECVVSVILRELHVSLHPGPADEAAGAGQGEVAGVFCRIAEVGIASRVTANYDPHEIELAVGNISAVQNISSCDYRNRRDNQRSVEARSFDQTDTPQEFLRSEVSSQSLFLMRSSLDGETGSAHTAIRVSRLTVTAHLPAIEELARLAERSAVEMFSTRADASRRLDEYTPLVRPQASTTAAGNGGMLSYASTAAGVIMKLLIKFMVALPPMLAGSDSGRSWRCSWLIPATDQAGAYLLQSRHCAHTIEVDIDGPSLSITQGQTSTAPQLTVWCGMIEANYTTSDTPSAAAFRGGVAEAETMRAAFGDALPRTSALRVRQHQHSQTQGRCKHADRPAQDEGQGEGLLFGNSYVCWSGFLSSLTHTLDGVPTVIRFNQQFQWQAYLSLCVLPKQFSALCGMPAATLKCVLDRVDFKAAPPDLVCANGLLDRITCALQVIATRFWPVMAQDPQLFYEGLQNQGRGASVGDHEVPDDMDLQRADTAQAIGNVTPKADIPGPHRKPHSNRPAHAVRWDGSRGDWLDDDGHIALPPPMDDSEFCTDLMYNLAAISGTEGNRGALCRGGGPNMMYGQVGAGENLVDQSMLEIVVDPQPITFTLQQNRGRPLLLVALDWGNVQISHVRNDADQRAGAVDISADMTLQAHFDNAHLARWEPVIEPWRSKVRLEVSPYRTLIGLRSERCLDINLSPAFLQGLWVSSMNEASTSVTPSKAFDHVSVAGALIRGAKNSSQAEQAQVNAEVHIETQEAAPDLNASPYWLRNSCGSRIEVRLRVGRDESGPGYLHVANQDRVALDAADYGAPDMEITEEGIRLESVRGCDLHVRFQHEGEEIEYVFESVNRVDTHEPRGGFVGRAEVICYVHITPEGTKVCEVCSRLRIQNRTRRPLEFGFSESAITVLVNEGECGYAPPQYCHAEFVADSIFVRPSRDFEWAEMRLEAQEVHRGVARCEHAHSGGGKHQQQQQQQQRQRVGGPGFTACFSCTLPDEQCPFSVLTLFDALTLQNMIPSTVTLDIFSSAGETAAETGVSLDFGETYIVPNWLPTQPAWLAVTDCRGSTSHRTLIHETELDKSWAKFGAAPQHELGHMGIAKRKVGALKMTSNVESTLRLRGGAFAVKHVSHGKMSSTDHFDVAIHHTDLVDAGHTVTLHVSHCVINRTEYPLYMKTDSKSSFVVVPAWVPPVARSTPVQENPILLPCSRPTTSQSLFGGGNSIESINVRFGCPVQQVSREDSSHRFVLLRAGFKRNIDAFGSDDLSSYAKIIWDSRVIAETEEVRSSRFPVWNKSMPINLSGRVAPMTVAVYDRRTIVSDSLLGEAVIPIENLQSKAGTDVILPLFTSSGRQHAQAVAAKRTREIAERDHGQGNIQADVSGVWRATSTDQRTTEYILLRESRKCELTGNHICGAGDAFVIQAGTHDHKGNEISFEQVYEQDGVRINWVGTLTSPDTMVGTWHGAGIHGSFDAVRLRELDGADLAVGFLTVRLEDVVSEEAAGTATGTNQHHDDVNHFVGNWSNELPISHDLAVGAGLPPITVDAGRQGKRQLGIYVEPPAIPLAPMVVAIVPRFVFYNRSGVALMLVDVDSKWMSMIEPDKHCEGFTAPRQGITTQNDVRHRLVVRKLRSAGVFVDSEIIDVDEPGIKWGIFPSSTDMQTGNEYSEDAVDVLTHLADDIHAHCQFDKQGTMVVTLRKAAEVDPPYHIINLSTVELEYRPKLDGQTGGDDQSASGENIQQPRYRKLGINKTAALHEHLWPRNRSHTTAEDGTTLKVHRLEVRVGGDSGEVRVFSLDKVNDRCPKWDVAIPTSRPRAVGGGRIRLRPQVVVDRQGLSLRFSTTRVGSRWIDSYASKIDVQMLGGISVSVISAQQSRGQQHGQVEHQRRELMYGRLHGIQCTSYISNGLRTVEVVVTKAQLDDQISQQVVLRPRLSSTDRQLHFCMVRTSPSTIDRVDLSIHPLVFTLKYPTAKRMFLWWKNIFDDSGDSLYPHSMQSHTSHGRVKAQAQAKRVLSILRDPSYKACVPSASNIEWLSTGKFSNFRESSEFGSLSSSHNGTTQLQPRVYIKSMRLRHVKLECTVDMVGAVQDPMASELLPFIFGYGTGSFSAFALFTLGLATKANSVNSMRLNIDEFERLHWFDTSESAFTTMCNHYSEQTMRQLFSLRGLASLEIFGAPLTKAKIVSESAHEGWLAVRDRDGIGMALSGVNMGKELIANTLTTASTMTQAFSGTVKNVIGDEVAMDRASTTTNTDSAANVANVRDGVSQGGKLLSEGLADAVTGVVAKPIEGLQQDGGAGLVRGTGEGLLGLVLKPVAAISDFVSASTEGLAQTLDSTPLTDNATPWANRPSHGIRTGGTMRNARPFGQFGELSELSTGDVMLRKLADRRGSTRSIHRGPHLKTLRKEEERCMSMLITTTAMQQNEHGQLSVTLITSCSLLHIVAAETAGSAMIRALQLQSRPQSSFTTVVSGVDLSEWIHSSGPEHWDIVEDRSLQDVFSVNFDAVDQTVTILLSPPCDGKPTDRGQERKLKLSRSPRIVDDPQAGDWGVGILGGVRDLLGFMDCVIKTTSHFQRQNHTLVDITNAKIAADGDEHAIDLASSASMESPLKKKEHGTLSHVHNSEPQSEGVAVEHRWLLAIYLTELDHGGLYDQESTSAVEPSSWLYSLEVYNAKDGVISSVTGLTAVDSAAIELHDHYEDCRLRVRRQLISASSSALLPAQQQVNQESDVVVLDADLPSVGVGAAWRRDWRIEDLNGGNIEEASINRSLRHTERSRYRDRRRQRGQQQQVAEVIDLTSPQPLPATGRAQARRSRGLSGGGGLGGVACLSAEDGSAQQRHRQSMASSGPNAVVDLIVEASTEHRIVHWSIPARVVADVATYRSYQTSRLMRTARTIQHNDAASKTLRSTQRLRQTHPQLSPVLDTSHEVIDLTGDEGPSVYNSIDEVEALEAIMDEMVVAATEGDVESLSRLTAQDPAMLHIRLPLRNISTNSGTQTSAFTGNDGTATALWLAAWKGHAEAVRWLLERGADGSSSYHCTSRADADSPGCTALHVSCIEGHSAVVRALLCDSRVNLTSRAYGGRTAAHCAAERGHIECLRLILHEGRRRGPPAPSVAAAMATRAPVLSVENAAAGRRRDSLSVREALDIWFFEFASSSVDGQDVVEKTAERDFLLCWVDAQNPSGMSADE